MANTKLTINNANRSQPEQARFIASTLGYKIAAKYLKNRGWSIEAAMWILFNK
jgi:hypothetical protein